MQKYILSILFISLIQINLIAGGGWPQPKGGGYFKLSQWWIISDQHYTDVGRKDPNMTTGVFNTSLYAEYGFTDRLTGILYFPFFSRTYFNNQVSVTTGEIIVPGEELNSIGDTDIALKYGLTKAGSPVAVSATLLFGLPLGNNAGGTQNNLQTGDGEFNQLLQIDAGKSFKIGEIPMYSNIYAGFNNRTNGFSDEFRFGFEIGASWFERKFWTIGRITGVESFKNGSSVQEINSTSIFANNTEFTSASLELAYYFTEKVGVSAGYAYAFRGEIIFAAPSYSIGVFLDI